MKINLLSAIIVIHNIGFFVDCRDPAKNIKNIVEDHGYSFEEHHVTTEDGYILSTYRVFKNQNTSQIEKPVALFAHGVFGSAVDWVFTGQNVSLAFFLADSGYDVWLLNARGTKNSKKHVNYSDKSNQFWNFSIHEIGFYDLPATVDYVLKSTGQSDLFYVGYSQGGAILFIMGSLRPEYNKKIRMAALLAPAVYLGHLSGISKIIWPFYQPFSALLDYLGHFELRQSPSFWRKISKPFCKKGASTQPLCFKLIYSLSGDGSDQEDPTSLTQILLYSATGLSTKQLFHFGFSMVHAGHFRQYDYGSDKNMIAYNSSEPPEYPLNKVNLPIAIFEGLNDIVIHPQDIDLLVSKLPNVVYREMITEKKFNHLDFIYGRDIKKLAYLKILDLFEAYRRNETVIHS